VAGADPYIIVAGGETIGSWEAYGLNSWTMVGEFITFDGVTASANGITSTRSLPNSIAQTIPLSMLT
jgi:hypothetical protein